MLSFKHDYGGESQKQYRLPRVEIKNYNATTDGRNIFGRPIKSDLKLEH